MSVITKHIPNGITSLNMLSGCLSIVASFEGQYIWAAIFIALAAVFDFFDGFAARLFNAYSAIGKELDSLADVVSFGVAPAILVFCYMRGSASPCECLYISYLPYIAFLIPVFSALRLAKFNIDERQSTSFIGLPTPANALFFIGAVFALQRYNVAYGNFLLAVFVILFSLLLVAELPMFSLKFKNYGLKGNKLRYLLIIITIACVLYLGIPGFSLAILLYILLSLLDNCSK